MKSGSSDVSRVNLEGNRRANESKSRVFSGYQDFAVRSYEGFHTASEGVFSEVRIAPV